MLIAHATDLTGDDASALLHAVALARSSGSRLVTVYAGPDGATLSPSPPELAARWGRKIDHEFRRLEGGDEVADTVLESLRELEPALVVVGTHGRHGLAALLRGSIGEAIVRNLDVPALVVPNRSRGFVDPRDGTLDLRRIVVPVGGAADARRGMAAARQLLGMIGDPDAVVELVHVGPVDPELDRLGLVTTRVEGVLEEAILDAVQARGACMIVMPTRGHDGAGDVLRGSHTERVIHAAGCPVLAVPL
ncbi:MAG TPA: universal stress protein [Kofleriaceae bacterium]